MNTLDCGHPPSEHSSVSTGYGTDKHGKRHCYACCAEQDKASMRATGRATLYLTKTQTRMLNSGYYGLSDAASLVDTWAVTNWPGSLRLSCGQPRTSRHNIARYRYDVWFTFEGDTWHGVQYGENTQLVHCRRTKGK